VTSPYHERADVGWREHWPEAFALAYLLLVAIALGLALRSLDKQEFDGLNNLFQVLLALPWAISPRGSDHVLSAYIDAGCGALNAALLLLFLRWVRRRRRVTSELQAE
jgi:ABC-type sugar transport system permease subunit